MNKLKRKLKMSEEMNLIPIMHRVLIKLDKDAEVTIGKIVMPEQCSEKKLKGFESGIISAIGPLAFQVGEYERENVHEGDRVYFIKHSGVAMDKLGGYANKLENRESYRIIEDADILAIEKLS